MPKVSIIIPAYNSEKVINHCVHSLLKQTFKDLEIIIVNDGSKDRTLEICRKLEKNDNRIKVVDKPNEGRVWARRIGYSLARGEFVGFMDHDDYLPKDAITCLYNLIIKHQVDCVIGTRARVYGSLPLCKKIDPIPIVGKVIHRDNLWEVCYGLSDNMNVDENFPGLVWGRLYRKSCIDNALMADPEHLFSDSLLEDWWFTLISLRYMNSVYATDDIVYYWRTGGASSGDLPMLEKSNNYFNYRLNYFKYTKCGGDVLMRTYICFVKTFYWELHLKCRSNKYDDKHLIDFISSQFLTQDVIDWAIVNQKQIPAEIKKYSSPIIDKRADEVLKVVYEMESKTKSKRLIRKYMIEVFDSTCDLFEKIGIIK